MTMKTSPAGVAFICGWEKFAATPYRDEGGKLTWGYGHCQRRGEKAPPCIDEPGARALMAADLADAEAAVRRGITAPLTQEQFDALVSLAFNAGAAAVTPATSSIPRLINSGQVAAAGRRFELWNKVRKDGALVESAGLLKRRRAERRIFETGVYDATH